MKRVKDGSSQRAPISSKDVVHQAQQGTCIPLNKEKKDADIQKGSYSIVSSFYDHARDGTIHLLTYGPIHMSVKHTKYVYTAD